MHKHSWQATTNRQPLEKNGFRERPRTGRRIVDRPPTIGGPTISRESLATGGCKRQVFGQSGRAADGDDITEK